MKYIRLTKEQFEELHPEFINFLATQSITGAEWAQIKEKQPEVVEQELDVFSDLIWEGVLSKARYLQNSSAQQLFLFKLEETEMKLIVAKVINTLVDLTTAGGLDWLQANLKSESVELFTASKAYSEERNTDVFNLITQGAEITDGVLYDAFQEFI
jgi:hypothetical protein